MLRVSGRCVGIGKTEKERRKNFTGGFCAAFAFDKHKTGLMKGIGADKSDPFRFYCCFSHSGKKIYGAVGTVNTVEEASVFQISCRRTAKIKNIAVNLVPCGIFSVIEIAFSARGFHIRRVCENHIAHDGEISCVGADCFDAEAKMIEQYIAASEICIIFLFFYCVYLLQLASCRQAGAK